MASGDWMKNPEWLANAGHFLAGASVLLVASLFTRSAAWLGGVEASLFSLVIIKEYVVDLRYESGEDVRSSTVDALGYLAGNLVAIGLVWLAWR